jgi:hypothetical protein
MAFPGLVRDRAAIAVRPAIADIFSLQADCLDRFPTAAFAWVALAAFTGAIRAASAKYSRTFLNGQNMHRSKSGSATAFAGLVRNKVAFAVILTVADIINFALIRGNKELDRSKQKQCTQNQNNSSSHRLFLLFVQTGGNTSCIASEQNLFILIQNVLFYRKAFLKRR